MHYCIPGPSLLWSDMLAMAVKKKANAGAEMGGSSRAAAGKGGNGDQGGEDSDGMLANVQQALHEALDRGAQRGPFTLPALPPANGPPPPPPPPPPSGALSMQEAMQKNMDGSVAPMERGLKKKETASKEKEAAESTLKDWTTPGSARGAKMLMFTESVVLPMVLVIGGFVTIFFLARKSATRQSLEYS